MYAKVYKVIYCGVIANRNNLETTEYSSTGDWVNKIWYTNAT